MKRDPFRPKRPSIDGMLLQRHQMFIRHADRRLLIVTVKHDRTFINQWHLDGDIVEIARMDTNLAFDGYGWNLAVLLRLLDGLIGRVCGYCGRAIAHNRLYCSDKCRMASHRARRG